MAELTAEQRAEIEKFEEEGEMGDGFFARSVLVGAAIGVPIVGVLVFVLFTVSDMTVSSDGIIGLALWSALWAGLLMGGVLGLGLKLLNLERKAHADH